jgi:hypothetical protein
MTGVTIALTNMAQELVVMSAGVVASVRRRERRGGRLPRVLASRRLSVVEMRPPFSGLRPVLAHDSSVSAA